MAESSSLTSSRGIPADAQELLLGAGAPPRPGPALSSLRSRPSRSSASSTAPSRPSKVVQTGVPSATASRFMVPPAEITRSASATRLGASIARSGTRKPRSRSSARCAGVRGSTTAWTSAQALEHLREQRVLEAVVERDLGRRAHHHDRLAAVEPELVEHGRVGLEVRQVVLLLEAGVAAQLAARRRSAYSRSGGIASRHDHRPCQAAVDAVLRHRPLVVERRRGRHAQQPGRDGHVVRPVAHRHVEAARRAPSARARGCARRGRPPCSTRRSPRWRPITVWSMPKRSQQLERLGEVARGDLDLVPVGAHRARSAGA